MRSPKSALIIFLLFSAIVIVATSSKSTDNSDGHLAYAELNAPRILSAEEIIAYNSKKQKLEKALKTYFNQARANGYIVGAGVSIVHGDSIVFANGFGKRDLKTLAEVNGNTVFRLGSLSKGFAGILAADLKSEGKLSWNDQITDFIPEFKFGTTANTSKVKVAHILSHTSGTPYHSFTNLVEAGLSAESISERFIEVQPLVEPGKQYSYQNAMFAMSQLVFKKATGKNTKTLFNERFFQPLGMKSVSMTHDDLMNTENKALPSVKRRSGWKSISLRDKYYNAVTAGGINASATDMGKWMRFLLGGNPEVMNSTEIQEVFNPVISYKNRRKYYQRWEGHLETSYGFGWRIHRFQETPDKEITVWHHGGSVNGFRNEIAMFPDSDIGICVLLNSQSQISKAVIPDLYKIVKEVFSSNQVKIKTESIVSLQIDNN